jgi:nucleoside-diphosphate-sugar epimerase
MRILLVGGSGFIGPYVVRELIRQAHHVAVFDRGQSKTTLPVGVQRIVGERGNLAAASGEFRRFAPDVVIDLILASEGQAAATMGVFRGIAGRVLALSSGDVYRAAGILHGTEEGPLQPVPLSEVSDLRRHRQPYAKEALELVRKVYPWIDDDYDKIPVERVVMNDFALPGTVLRLPMIYGPGDPLHRLYPYLKRIDDGRPAILIQDDAAAWRGPRGYVENVAAGIALAATSPQASGRIYNLAETEAFSEQEWAQAIGRSVSWKGAVFALPRDAMPAHLRVPYNSAQHWTMSSARIREELGYREPVSLDDALKRTILWERESPPPQVDPKQFDYASEDAALRSYLGSMESSNLLFGV